MSQDVRRMVAEIREALDAYPREQLQEILAYVFKEYVVEGAAAPAQGALAMLDARSELEGLSFAELVTWLQLHLDVPELAQLEVQNGRVSVRAGGRAIAIEAPRAPEAAPVAATPAAATRLPSPARQPVSSPSSSSSPSPSSPSSVPSPSGATSPQPLPTPNPPSASPSAPPPGPANQPSAADQKEEGEAPSSRFSWLEVD